MSTSISNLAKDNTPKVAPSSRLPRRRWISVRLRFLILVVGSGLIILGLGSFVIFNIAQNVALAEVRLRTNEIVNNTALQLNDRLVRLSESAHGAAAAAYAEAGDLTKLRTTLSQIGQRELDFLSIYVFFDRQAIAGHDYAAVWETRDTMNANRTTKPYYPNLIGAAQYEPNLPVYDYFQNNPRFDVGKNADKGRVIWTDNFPDKGGPGNTNVVAGVTPIYDASDHFTGIAGIDLDFSQIRTYVAAIKPTANSYAMLLDRNGLLIAHAKDTQLNALGQAVSQIAQDNNSTDLKQLGDQMTSGQSGVTELTDPLTGIDVFAAYHPIDTTGWSIAVLIPIADVTGNVNQMGGSILALSLTALGAFGLIGLLLSETVVRPLIRLTKTATLMSGGDLKQIAVIERNDEIGTMASTLNTMTSRLSDLIDSLENRVELRTAQLQASADVGQAATSVLDADQLLKTVVNLITDRFGFYYAAAFIVDDSRHWAVLAEATGEGGRKLKERGHKLEVGGQSMVGSSIAERKPKIALDVGAVAVRFANPLLPDTRSEIALPLILGDHVLGALDVQSTLAAAFDETSTAVLQSMADQVAVALNNADQYQREQARSHQTAALLTATLELTGEVDRSSLADRIVQLSTRILKADGAGLWLINNNTLGLTAALSASGPAATAKLTPHPGDQLAQRVYTSGQIIRVDDYAGWLSLNDSSLTPDLMHAAIGVPLFWRNQINGVLVISQSEPDLRFTDNDESAAQLLASQAAAAIANVMLLQQQEQTLKELNIVNRRLTGEAWQSHLQGHAIVYEAKRSAAQLIEPALSLQIPVALRGQAIGAITIEDDDSQRTLTDDERGLIHGIIQQMTLALENQRLTEVTQLAAQRDRAIAEAADKIHRPTDLDAVLQVAVEEISRIVGTRDVRIRLGVDTSPGDGNGRQNVHA
ncbi:MAG TPA: GAF domain-containing protein [Anaerolineae bacterium]|nr:GAF domain-containing protein [Anaerolineae bacterium]